MSLQVPKTQRYNPFWNRQWEEIAEPSYEELKAKVAELEKQAGAHRFGELEFKVGEKGGVSVYGLGRFPVTLGFGSLMLARNCGRSSKRTKLRAG